MVKLTPPPAEVSSASATPVSGGMSTPAYFANDLTQDGKLAFICHNDQIYTLRITRAGKLILTK